MTFWGCEVKPDKPVTADFLLTGAKLILTQATLGNGSSPCKTILECHVRHGSYPIFLCTLVPKISESCSLNLEFDNEDDVKFSVVGPTSVHLAGFFKDIPQDLDDEGHGYDANEEDIVSTESRESGKSSKEFSDYDFVDNNFNHQKPREKPAEKPEHIDLQSIANDLFKTIITPFVEDIAYSTLMQTITNLKPRTIGQVLALLGYQPEVSSLSQNVEEELCGLYVYLEGCLTRVAYAKMSSSRVLDDAILPSGVVKVKIHGPIEKFAPLPIPVNDEITQVGHAVQKYIAWPRDMCFTISDFKGSNTGKQSHLGSFVQRVVHDYEGDIAWTESENSDYYMSEECSDYDLNDGSDSRESDSNVEADVDTKKGKHVEEEEGDSDILSESLRKPMNMGRMRDSLEGGGPSLGMSQQDVKKMVNDVVKMALPELPFVKSVVIAVKEEMLQVLTDLFPGTVDEALMNMSLIGIGVDPPAREKVKHGCDLYSEFEGSRVLVARGELASTRNLSDWSLPDGVLKVKINRAIENFAPLPIIFNYHMTQVCDAVKKYVAWPSNLCDTSGISSNIICQIRKELNEKGRYR